MAVHFDEDLLRLSDDYPDQRQWANQPQGSSIHSSSHQGGASGPFVYAASLDNSSTVRRRSSKGAHICTYHTVHILNAFIFLFLLLTHIGVDVQTQHAIIVGKPNASVNQGKIQEMDAVTASCWG